MSAWHNAPKNLPVYDNSIIIKLLDIRVICIHISLLLRLQWLFGGEIHLVTLRQLRYNDQ